MTRRALLTAFCVGMTAKTVTAQSGFAVTGPLSATSTEQSEGYAQLGNVLMVAVNPKGDLHPRLMELVGRTVRIEVAPVA